MTRAANQQHISTAYQAAYQRVLFAKTITDPDKKKNSQCAFLCTLIIFKTFQYVKNKQCGCVSKHYEQKTVYNTSSPA